MLTWAVTQFSLTGDNLALMVNNLGGTSVLELNIVAHEAVQWLGQFEYSFCDISSKIVVHSKSVLEPK